MKKQIKKLLCSSLVVFMSIGMHFNAEARVTKEVAEAVIPYLIELLRNEKFCFFELCAPDVLV